MDREFVTWCYRVILGREPESEQVIDIQINSRRTRRAVVTEFLLSQEFLSKNPIFAHPREWVWVEVDDALLRVNLADRMLSAGIITKQYEIAETRFLKANTKPGDIVVDLGANIGYYTIILGSIVGPTGRVYSFEPMPDMFETLNLSIQINGFEDRIVAHNVAISDRDGSIPMFYNPTKVVNYGAQIAVGQEGPPGARLIDVPTGRLCDFIQDPTIHVLKIDVEGAEPLAIGGSLEWLEKRHPIILSEINVKQLESVSRQTPADYINLLSSIGYKGHILGNDGSLGPVVDPQEISDVVNVVFVSA